MEPMVSLLVFFGVAVAALAGVGVAGLVVMRQQSETWAQFAREQNDRSQEQVDAAMRLLVGPERHAAFASAKAREPLPMPRIPPGVPAPVTPPEVLAAQRAELQARLDYEQAMADPHNMGG